MPKKKQHSGDLLLFPPHRTELRSLLSRHSAHTVRCHPDPCSCNNFRELLKPHIVLVKQGHQPHTGNDTGNAVCDECMLSRGAVWSL